MIPPRDSRLHKAIRLIKSRMPLEFAFFEGWMHDALAANRASVQSTLDPAPLNRLLGEQYALSSIVEEIDEAPAREAAAANGASVVESLGATSAGGGLRQPGNGIPRA